jgi:NAD(P)-dependent dehydrogenase (short-subunit alcohol dehydrogenase family)
MPEPVRFDLTGKVALVTGASSGLGRRFALVLAKAGAKVGVAARRTDKLTEVVREIEAFDGRAVPIPLDVTDPASVRAAVAAAETELGPIGVLVNNAGTIVVKPLLDHTVEEWDRVLDTNLKGVWLMAQEVARHMVRLGHGGSIVNIASMLGLTAQARRPSYCAAKAGVIHLSRAMAIELAPHKIRVNAIAPGFFASEMTHGYLASDAGRAMAARIPMKRTGAADELDGTLLLLASDASSYMTGAVLTVDGGHSLGV